MRDPPRPILQHLEELRRRTIIIAILFALGFIAALVFYHPLVNWLLVPAHNHLSATGTPVVTGLTEFMSVTLKMAFFAGFILALPVLVYQIIMFIAPAISDKAERSLIILLPSILLLFAGGVSLAYFTVVPTMLKFLLTFGSDLVTPMIRIGDYLNVVIMLLGGLGLAFETPIIMYLLAKFNIVSYHGFMRYWRHVVVLAFILGAIFDPTPNPLDQIVVAGCIITLYWVGILITWIIQSRQAPVVEPQSAHN